MTCGSVGLDVEMFANLFDDQEPTELPLERDLKLMGPINPLALQEFQALQERHDFLEAQLEDIRTTRRDLNKVIRAIDEDIVSVFAAYREAHPRAPRLVVGDVSFRNGGTMDQHASHQNGLDVDVYYPRLDRRERPPRRVEQIDRRLAQDLVDRFVRAGAEIVYVGPLTGFTGPPGVVQVLWNHDNHLHVRITGPP